MRVATERSYPYLFASGVWLGFFIWNGWSILTASQSAKILDNIFTLTAVGLGFWATAAALLLAVEEKSIIKRLRKGQHFSLLVGYLLSAITWEGILMVITLALIAFSGAIKARPVMHRVAGASWVAALAAGALTTFRAYYCLGSALKAACSQDNDVGG